MTMYGMYGPPVRILLLLILLCSCLTLLTHTLYSLVLPSIREVDQLSSMPPPGLVTPSTFNEIFIHLDFKGAPPRVAYLPQILPIISSSGATGLLLEWEDMLPHRDGIPSRASYNNTEIFAILAAAEIQGLSTVPLLPLYSGLDFVLKLGDFAHLRQNFEDTRYICPNGNGSLTLLFRMIERVFEFHRDTKYFHVGFQGPFPQECSPQCCQGHHIHDVIIRHLHSLIRHFSQHYPHVTLLIWDDLLRTLPMSQLAKLMGVGKFVIPVIRQIHFDFVGMNLENYVEYLAAIFPRVWVSGEYNRAVSQQDFRLVPNLRQQLELNWEQVDFVEAHQHRLDHPITSFVLLGAQRDSHYSPLNELLPASLPAMCLASHCLRYKTLTHRGVQPLLRDLRCPPIHPTDVGAYARCQYPGAGVYGVMVQLRTLIMSEEYSELQEWKHSHYMQYNIRHRNLPALMVRNSLAVVDTLWTRVHVILDSLREQLEDKIFRRSDVDEWTEQNILPILLDIKTMRLSLTRMKSQKKWARRPFPPSRELVNQLGSQEPVSQLDSQEPVSQLESQEPVNQLDSQEPVSQLNSRTENMTAELNAGDEIGKEDNNQKSKKN